MIALHTVLCGVGRSQLYVVRWRTPSDLMHPLLMPLARLPHRRVVNVGKDRAFDGDDRLIISSRRIAATTDASDVALGAQ